MKNLRIAGLVMVILVAVLSNSCSSNKSSGGSSYANPEVWKILKESDWAAWVGNTGCEMKFVGDDKAITMDWLQDTTTKAWNRAGSDVGTVEFLDENWFVIHYSNKSTAYLFTKGDNSFESSTGAIFRKNQINTFRPKK
ncbi:MAG: hypothetical protein M0Q38_02855 [Bacteroidales bacterium]|jgi:hypothetical protein|nr:hypothetical protein [Bacteroidales bacterium]